LGTLRAVNVRAGLMRLFQNLYDKVLVWSRHRHAERYLGALSFAESSFFPIPPDVMLAPMVLAQRQRAWWLAALTTLTSVIGGVAGYLIGRFLFDQIGQPVVELYHAQEKFEHVKALFLEYGIWIVFIAGFTPIPYKLFTITSGVMSMALLPFVLASAIGRGARFFLVAGLLYFGGERFESFLRQWIDVLGWAVLFLAGLAFIILK